MKIGDRCFVHGYIDEIRKDTVIVRNDGGYFGTILSEIITGELPSAQPEIIRCKDCKHWRQQTNYQGAPLSFGFCESDDMWRSLYGEIYEVSHIDTDDDFYCGYAERRTDETD